MEEQNFPDGDCRYQAKETFNDDPDLPFPDLKKADIYSLGMTIYELIEGIELKKEEDDFLNVREGKWDFTTRAKETYSAELLETVRKMLDINPDNRPPTNDLLEGFLQSEQEK
mmetsp:Transcript_31977/g.23638  ORF Transcript_31977/g.23638 Transcript_31977/m.23638 type:complete len:113 (+) Transcript_31977:919-1257(+)|eukprot:CAMPEP_0202967834 /NCGR_PEP_ID=MMETSP1396-20130829/12856_1 /ASSEMBLY_ACC=CAM_ASM_000872 /TAXON_ID= /ORGANISM="Pseudokeronopsis sp., Strain Brazil" /LENGTH=112 /DNA_ID=CAMNT_0049693369 /DNA_START=199 /DNA_END=537 /DNA_ORIENTATION=-